MNCRVCNDYGVVRGKMDMECPCRDFVQVRNGEGFIGTHATRTLAALWFDGGDAQEIANAAGVTREQLTLALEYEAHRPPSKPPKEP